MTDGLQIRGLSVSVGRRQILKDISIPRVAPGRIVAMVGPNGAGKSTALKALGGSISASGNAFLGTDDLLRMGLSERARYIGYMPQTLPEGIALSVIEGVMTALRAGPTSRSLSHAETRRHSLTALERLGIARLALRGFDTLSGGQRQLASLAQAIVREPGLLLLDEPTSALDLAHQIQVMERIEEFARVQDAVVVIVLHDLELACRWADFLAVLHDGGLTAFGPPKDVVTRRMLRSVYGVEADVTIDDAGRTRIFVERTSVDLLADDDW